MGGGVERHRGRNRTVHDEGGPKVQPRILTESHAIETVLTLAPETNGEVAVKAWEALGKATGRDHAHLALSREDEKFRFHDLVAQPRKIISRSEEPTSALQSLMRNSYAVF